MRTAREAQQSRLYDVAITVGLIAYGVVYLLIAWIALQLAWGKSSGDADQQGALQELAGKPFGDAVLWVVAAGLLALVIWRVLELVYGYLDLEGKVQSIGRGLVYLALSISAAKVAMGSAGSSSNQQSGLSAKLMQNGAGRVLIVIVGLVVFAVGIRQVYKSVTKKFTEDLVGGVSESTILLGRIGYAAKGVAFVIVGGLFAWASFSYDAKKAGGLDTALRTIKDQPFGSVLLTLMAVGLACFGLYCFVWSRNAKH